MSGGLEILQLWNGRREPISTMPNPGVFPHPDEKLWRVCVYLKHCASTCRPRPWTCYVKWSQMTTATRKSHNAITRSIRSTIKASNNDRHQDLSGILRRCLRHVCCRIFLRLTNRTHILSVQSALRSAAHCFDACMRPYDMVPQVVNRDDSVTYALRRFDNVRTSSKITNAAQDKWRHIRHPNLMGLERAFIHHKALFFLHSYWPTAQTLSERYVASRQPVSESTLWSYLTQLSSAIRSVHINNLACRCISTTRIMVTSGSRVSCRL